MGSGRSERRLPRRRVSLDLRPRQNMRMSSRSPRDNFPLNDMSLFNQNANSKGRSELELRNLEAPDFRSLSIHDFPSLPLVDTTNVEYGRPRNVELHEKAYVPTRLVELVDFLKEPRPQPAKERTRKQKCSRRAHQALALLKNPRADVRYPYLPPGLNLRIGQKQVPIKRRIKDWLHPQVREPKKSNFVTAWPFSPFAGAPELTKREGLVPAPPRYIPKVEKAKPAGAGCYFDEWNKPFGEVLLFPSPEERAKKILILNAENKWRKQSNLLLARRGREHLCDCDIGRAPPLSKHQILAAKALTLNIEEASVSVAKAITLNAQNSQVQSPAAGLSSTKPAPIESTEIPQIRELLQQQTSLKHFAELVPAPELRSLQPSATEVVDTEVPFLPAPRKVTFALQHTIFVGFARLPDSSFVSSLNTSPGGSERPSATSRLPAASGPGSYSSLLRNLAASQASRVPSPTFESQRTPGNSVSESVQNHFLEGGDSVLSYPGEEAYVDDHYTYTPQTSQDWAVYYYPGNPHTHPPPRFSPTILADLLPTPFGTVPTPSPDREHTRRPAQDLSSDDRDRTPRYIPSLESQYSRLRTSSSLGIDPATRLSHQRSPSRPSPFDDSSKDNSSPWLGFSLHQDPDSDTLSSLPLPRTRPRKFQKSLDLGSFSDNQHPWPLSKDPFSNPPQYRKESWDQAAALLFGDDLPEEEPPEPITSPALQEAVSKYGLEELELDRQRYRGSKASSYTKSIPSTPHRPNAGSIDLCQRSKAIQGHFEKPAVTSPVDFQTSRVTREPPPILDYFPPPGVQKAYRRPLPFEHSPQNLQKFSFPGGTSKYVKLPGSSLPSAPGAPSSSALADSESPAHSLAVFLEEASSSRSSIITSPTRLPKHQLRRKKTFGEVRLRDIAGFFSGPEEDDEEIVIRDVRSGQVRVHAGSFFSQLDIASLNLQEAVLADASDWNTPALNDNQLYLNPADCLPPAPTRTPPPIPKKSPERQELIRQENTAQQNQILTELGSKFSPSPEKYPSSVVDGLPSPLESLTNLQERRKHRQHKRSGPISLPAGTISLPSSAISSSSPQSLGPAFLGSPRSPFPELLGSPRHPPYSPRSATYSGSPRSSVRHASASIPSSRLSGTGTDVFSVRSVPQTLFTPATISTSVAVTHTSKLGGSIENYKASCTLSIMDNQLQVRSSDYGSVKTKAIEDAKAMQALVLDSAKKSGRNPPKYVLMELIGKGSFGRVYKAKDMTSADVFAVKIIDIDESDNADPRNADTLSDFMKEINALKLLGAKNAKNINNVVDAFPVGHSMWMITEYCGGGSVATLMKPTAPGGLQEKWIITILREVIEAITWVHEVGIVHRDIKCANVLITEDGGLQLCDFGVAGVVETKFDKRSTVVGTPHWMAPELFGPSPKYGTEVDIWALGSMVYEMATGLPPNAANGISVALLPSHLQNYIPRLVGDQYSAELQDFVAACLEELPSARPTIQDCKNHPYTFNTSVAYPTTALVALVRAFKLWEDRGGTRRSLFMVGGAQGPTPQSDYSPFGDDEWNFSTTAAFDQQVSRNSTPQDLYDAYGTGVIDFSEETSRPPPPQQKTKRRPPPEALAPLPVPLQKIFDSNTLSNYNDNSRELYGRIMQPPSERPSRPVSDLPLRDDTAHTSIRDTMIDLGGHDIETGVSSFPEDTIRAERRSVRDEDEDEYGSLHDFSKPALSDPADMNPNRRTQDWKFPSMIPASADPETSRFPVSYDIPRPAVVPVSAGRPSLIHHPTEPIGGFVTASANDRMSLIDLDDASVPSSLPELTRPSTANSDVGSAASEYTSSGNPFELERHASMYQPTTNEREDSTSRSTSKNGYYEGGLTSDFSTSDADTASRSGNEYNSDSDYLSMPPPRRPQPPTSVPAASSAYGSVAPNPPHTSNIEPLQAPPSSAAMSGAASYHEMMAEFDRLFGGMNTQLTDFRGNYIGYKNSGSGSGSGPASRRQGGEEGGSDGEQ